MSLNFGDLTKFEMGKVEILVINHMILELRVLWVYNSMLKVNLKTIVIKFVKARQIKGE